MNQTSTHVADQSQQPKHDEQRDNCPQHYSLLLMISSSSQVISTCDARRRSHFDKPQGLCRTVCGLYSDTEAPYCDTANNRRPTFDVKRLVFDFTGSWLETTRSCGARQRARRKLHAV